jgi:hypothetical protein
LRGSPRLVVGDIDCSVYHILKVGDVIQGCGEKLDLLSPCYVGDEEDYAGMYFESQITAAKLERVVCDQNPVVVYYDLQNVPVLRFPQPIVVDMRGFVSSYLGDLG